MLFEQISSNRKKTWLFIGTFILFVYLIGLAASYLLIGDWLIGIIITSIILVIYVPVKVFGSTKTVMKWNHAIKIESKDMHPTLWYAVENMAMVARIPVPSLYLIQDDTPNAFASGISPDKASIAVTTGLLEKLNREEIEAVIAHEVAHIQNYDVRLMTIALSLVAVIAILSDLGTRIVFGDSNKKHPLVLILALILLMLAPFISLILQMALSRNREFLADAQGASLCRNPLALASALQKITSDTSKTTQLSKSCARLYISDPFKREAHSRFSTHPSPEQRIERLTNM